MHIFKQSEGGTLLTLLLQFCAGFVSRLHKTAQCCSWALASFREGRQIWSAAATNKQKRSALKGDIKAFGDVMDPPAPGRVTLWRHIKHRIY